MNRVVDLAWGTYLLLLGLMAMALAVPLAVALLAWDVAREARGTLKARGGELL